MPLRGEGGGLMAKTILNFHFDYLHPSLRRKTFLIFQINRRHTRTKFVRVSFKCNRPAITGHCWISKSPLDFLSLLPLSPRDYLCRSNISLRKDKFVNNLSKKCNTLGRYITPHKTQQVFNT